MDDEQFNELVGLLREIIERLDTLNENMEMNESLDISEESIPPGSEGF